MFCPECGNEMKRPPKPEKWDNSMICKNGHVFDVFVVAGHITIHSSDRSVKNDT